MHALSALIPDESGATMVEYGMIVALVAMLSLTAILSIGTTVSSFYFAAGNSV